MDNTFQIILMGVFLLAALAGVVIFASPGLLPGGSERPPVSFTAWGEWEAETFEQLLDATGIAGDDNVTISYRSVAPDQFEAQLVNALARGQGPDVVLIPHTKLLPLLDLITVIGEDFFPARQFRDSFVEGSEIFLSNQGVYALPVAVDPLVMYWNRDILTEAGYTTPPVTWDDVATYVPSITNSDNTGNISTAGIGLGTADNIFYIKEILSSLFLQINNGIVGQFLDGELVSVLSEASAGNKSAASAVSLYTQYANPDTSVYTWNNSFNSAEEAFTAGNLALYLGMSSDIQRLRQRNPNLNFDVAILPQLSEGSSRVHGLFYGFAIINQASNKAGILTILQELTSLDAQQAIATQTNFTPIHKGVLASGARDAYKQVFFQSAIITRAWLDPDPAATREIFADIIRDVTGGRRNAAASIQAADTAINNLLRRFNR
ncbi:MAG: extracellular solute-binding protein [Candidatus Paceibacterota bacterium]